MFTDILLLSTSDQKTAGRNLVLHLETKLRNKHKSNILLFSSAMKLTLVLS